MSLMHGPLGYERNLEIDGQLVIDALPEGEKVTNPNFTGAATGWTLGGAWAYNANAVDKNADGTTTLSQDVGAIANEIYRVVYTVSNWSVGTVTVAVGGVSGTARGADGTYTEYIKATGTGSLTFTPTNTARFTVDTVSVTRVGVATTDRVVAWVGDRVAAGVAQAADAGLFLMSEDGTLSFFGDSWKLGAGDDVEFSIPAADTLAISTGGTEALRVDSTGNMGIGVTAYSTNKLQVKCNTNQDLAIQGAISLANAVVINAVTDDAQSNIPMELRATAFGLFGGALYINDTANANMTTGLTIQQGDADNEILAGKSSDVAHGVTTVAETDTFFALAKAQENDGGLSITAIRDLNTGALILRSISPASDTAKATTAQAHIYLTAQLTNGTGVQDVAADGNLLAIRNNATTRFIFDAEGSAHADVEWIAFDTHDDVALLNKLDAALTQDPIKTEFGRYLTDYQAELQAAKIVNFYDPQGPRAMLNTTRLAMLHTGAIRQLGRIIDSLTERLQLAESRLAALPQPN